MARSVRDAVVVGLGVVGSATARELARRGRDVLGLDRFGPAHRRGSSHGESRLIRSLYHEGPGYVPLLRRAYAGWRGLEGEAGRELLLETGGLAVGPPDGRLVTGCLAAASEHGLAFEALSPAEVRRRFPAFDVPAGHRALLDPAAGVLRAERCLAALRSGARAAGAELRFGERVAGWSAAGGRLVVEADGGQVECGALVLAAGGWTADLLEAAGEASPPLTVERQSVHRFPAPRDSECGPDRFPVFLAETGRPTTDGATEADSSPMAYGAPDLGRGVKVAVHHGGETSRRPAEVRRRVDPAEARSAREAVEELLPRLGRSPVASDVCLYANTPDRDFVIDRLSPDGPPVVAACGLSGHGFKFAPAVAGAAADLAQGAAPPADVAPFRLGRWSN